MGQTSEPLPTSPPLRLSELVATLALAQDSAFGQPLESQLRSCLLAGWLTAELELPAGERAATYWVALLRYLGCTGHAHEVAVVFGDEIALRARSLVVDVADPLAVLRDLMLQAGRDRPPAARVRSVLTMLAGGRSFAARDFAAGCEVADVLAARLGFDDDVRSSLRATFERWNGKGFPAGAKGEAIPRPMRVVHLTQDMEAIARLRSPGDALDAVKARRGRTYDPAVVDAFLPYALGWLERLEKLDPWDEVIATEPAPHRLLEGAELDAALEVVADFVDLKSPFMGGHSRRVAELAAAGATRLGLPPGEVEIVRRAALVHDLGMTGIPNSIWDKPAPLTRSELDRIELHTMLTEQMLRRSPALAELRAVAAGHHERANGSGYHKGLVAAQLPATTRVLAAADAYAALTADRAYRPAFSTKLAAAEVRRAAADGSLDHDAVEAVLAGAGHAPPPFAAERRREGLTPREVEVLRLAAQGFTTKQIASRLVISAKTADHHIQHVYTKIGVSSRGAAALWAIQHGLAG